MKTQFKNIFKMAGITCLLVICCQGLLRAESTIKPIVAGEVLRGGETWEITWAPFLFRSDAGTLNILLWDGVKGTTTVIKSNVDADLGTYTWIVPSNLRGDRFRIKVQCTEVGGVCEMTASYFSIRNPKAPTGVDRREAQDKLSVTIAPNPASQAVACTWKSGARAEVSILDASGRAVAAFPAADGSLSFSVETYAAGVYFVRLSFENGDVIQRKLVVR